MTGEKLFIVPFEGIKTSLDTKKEDILGMGLDFDVLVELAVDTMNNSDDGRLEALGVNINPYDFVMDQLMAMGVEEVLGHLDPIKREEIILKLVNVVLVTYYRLADMFRLNKKDSDYTDVNFFVVQWHRGNLVLTTRNK